MMGKVLFFNNKEGYGFIRSDESEKDIYFSYTQIQSKDSYKTVLQGQTVEFDLNQAEHDENKLYATNVRPVPLINAKTGKKVMLVTLMYADGSDTVSRLEVEIAAKEARGIKYVRFDTNMVLGTSEPIDVDEMDKILYFIDVMEIPTGIIDTMGELDYDLLFVS